MSYTVELVICDQKRYCDEAKYCGGAKPHSECPECGNCPRNKNAKCVPYVKEIE